MRPKIGFHVSISGGISNSIDNALKIGCNAFQIFSRNPRGWVAKPLHDLDVENFRKKLNESKSKIDRNSIFVHMPYLPNLSSSNGELHKKSTDTLLEEVKRCSTLGIPYVILHLGRHGEKGKEDGIKLIQEACNSVTRNYPQLLSPVTKERMSKKGDITKDSKSVMMLLENSAGGRNSIGSRFGELGLILDKLKSSSGRTNSFGICLDTCHAFAAGYDLRTKEGIEETLDEFQSEIGLGNLKVIHLNDSREDLNSNRDRHEHIGLGKIGQKGFREFLRHNVIRKLPIIMETPIDSRRGDSDNLKIVLDLLN
ncbi:MAG: deoxyribonuclease IV [Thermoproteota archaeon]|jgi:deoxyribonuclease-4|nr:deoxyribonuclease IV [Thermoproteota archaeon]